MAEVFAPHYTADQLRLESERLGEAAEARDRSEEPVRCVSALLVPGEETAFFFFEAPHAADVERVLQAAGVDPDRISTVIPSAGNALIRTIDPDRPRAMGSCEGQLEGVPRAAESRGDEEDA